MQSSLGSQPFSEAPGMTLFLIWMDEFMCAGESRRSNLQECSSCVLPLTLIFTTIAWQPLLGFACEKTESIQQNFLYDSLLAFINWHYLKASISCIQYSHCFLYLTQLVECDTISGLWAYPILFDIIPTVVCLVCMVVQWYLSIYCLHKAPYCTVSGHFYSHFTWHGAKQKSP